MAKSIKYPVMLVIGLLMSAGTLFAQKMQQGDSTLLVFDFEAHENDFLLATGKNRDVQKSLFEAIDRYRQEIESGAIPVYVNGYCASFDTQGKNLNVAYNRASQVKSDMIVKKSLVEENFITGNFAGAYNGRNDVVTVVLKVKNDAPKIALNNFTTEEKPVKELPKQATEKKAPVKETVTPEPQTKEQAKPAPAISQTIQPADNLNVRGKIVDELTNQPVVGAKVTLLNQNLSTFTNAAGEYSLYFVSEGDEEMMLSAANYFNKIVLLNIKPNADNYREIALTADQQADARQDIILQLSETQLYDEGGDQSVSGAITSGSDVYLSQTGYSFSPMRFRTRGYDNKYESTYINGVHFFDAERGGFNYSSIGGLNNATRNRDVAYGLAPNSFSYGNIGASTNINTRASSIAAGSHANVALSNRAYKFRGQYTYGTGIMENGWAFAASGVVRWSDDKDDILKLTEGTFYNSAGLFLSAEKFFGNSHSLSLVAFGAPTRRAGQAPITQEARDLAGSIYYNPYWGYQDGKIRSSRTVETFDPTAILSHEWKISETQRLRTGAGFHYSWYSNSAFAYDGLHPAPDYYRNMPSFPYNEDGTERNAAVLAELTNLWQTDESTQQINWNKFYERNYNNNLANPNGQARYALIRRHNNLMEATLNSTYTNQINPNLKLTAGIEARKSKGMHYQTIDDLLGANQLIDKDTYAERDLVGGTLQDADPRIVENDLNDKNKIKKEDDIFGYNYDMNVTTANAFAQVEYNYDRLNIYAALKGTYTDFYRYGHMENGRAWYLREIRGYKNIHSFGKSATWWFVDPSAKAGFAYNIDNRSRISANILAETRAPLVQDAYVSERIKDVLVPNLTSEKLLSYDLNYTFNYRAIRGRVSGFRTHVHDAVEKLGYYDDEYHTFINHLLSGANKIYQGVEAGISVPVNGMITLSAAGTFADYSYTNNVLGIKSYENGAENDTEEKIMTKGLKINAGPQMAANITLDFFYKMWFFDITLNYYDNNYLDFAPNRFTQKNFGNLPAEFYGEKNMNMLRSHFIDQKGTVHETKLNEWLNNSEYKAYWGLAENETMQFGDFGEIIQKVANTDGDATAIAIEPTEARKKLGMQEKLKGGFVLDLSVGRIIYLKNRKSLNFNLSVSNVLNNTDLISGGYQQARIPRYGNGAINQNGLNWFPNKYYYAMGLNFFMHIGFKF